jgi:hypothetical protein
LEIQADFGRIFVRLAIILAAWYFAFIKQLTQNHNTFENPGTTPYKSEANTFLYYFSILSDLP